VGSAFRTDLYLTTQKPYKRKTYAFVSFMRYNPPGKFALAQNLLRDGGGGVAGSVVYDYYFKVAVILRHNGEQG
jgi:hypothetical protein